MKICSKDPRYGVAVCDGQRYTCEPGGFIDVAESYGKQLLKMHPDLMEYGTEQPTPLSEEQPPVDPLTLLDPPPAKGKGKGAKRGLAMVVPPPEDEDEPDDDSETDALAALEEGTEEE